MSSKEGTYQKQTVGERFILFRCSPLTDRTGIGTGWRAKCLWTKSIPDQGRSYAKDILVYCRTISVFVDWHAFYDKTSSLQRKTDGMMVRGSPCPISAWLTRSCNPARDFPFSFQIFVDKFAAVQYTVKALRKQFEAWLSLVERSVRDAEAASSNLVASIHPEKGSNKARPIGQAVKTEPSHGSNPGSIPGSVTLLS